MRRETFGKHLLYLLRKNKISQQELADRLGKSQKTISRYVNGETGADEEVQQQILRAVSELTGNPADAQLPEDEESALITEFDPDNAGSALRDIRVPEEEILAPFAGFTLEMQQYVLRYIGKAKLLTFRGTVALTLFRSMPPKNQRAVEEDLARYTLNFERLTEDPREAERIAFYLEMVSHSEKRPKRILQANLYPGDFDPDAKERAKALAKYRAEVHRLGIKSPLEAMTFAFCAPRDWYRLVLFEFLYLHDSKDGGPLPEDGIGDKYLALERYMRDHRSNPSA